MIETIVHINGNYDIICGLCLMGFCNIPILNLIHTNMFIHTLEPITKRHMGVYIFLQGCIRLSYSKKNKKDITYITYLLEMFWIINEMFNHHNIKNDAGLFVILVCLSCAFVTKN